MTRRGLSVMNDAPTHLVIPDTQAKPGAPTAHLRWIGQYIVDQFAGRDFTIVHLGDHWDMPSLSSYDKGKKSMEGRRYNKDIEAGNEHFDILNTPLWEYNEGRRKKWNPRKVFLLGNHEARITRAANDDAQVDGLVTLDDLNVYEWGWDWEVHDFLEPVLIDGVTYAHYFANRMTGRSLGGQSMDARIKTIGHSFTMGHQQGLWFGRRETLHSAQLGLVAGSCYLHDEDYKGPQGNKHWRGIVVKHQVEKGEYDPMFVSLDYLCRKYEGVKLRTFLQRGRRR